MTAAGAAAPVSEPVDRARALAPLLAQTAPRTEAERRIGESVIAALHDARLFRMLMPRDLGGGEARPSEFVEVIETLARADASPAWCLCQMAVCNIAAAYLKPHIAQHVFGAPNAALAWGSTRDAKAVAVDGGYRVSGTWEFGSGCHHATWLGGHCPVVGPDGAPLPEDDPRPRDRTVLFPKSAARIDDVWRTLGLRGTGSDVYALDDLFVPEDHAVLALHRWPDRARQAMAAPFRFGPSSLYGPGFGALALGNARGMLDDFIAFASRKTPLWNRNPISQNTLVQVAVAEADARVESARVYLLHTVRELEAAAMIHGALDADQRMKLRGASTFAIRVATAVVDAVYDMTGTTAVFDGEEMQRRFRDAHTISQHLQGRVSHLETVGKHLLGVTTDLRFA